MNSILFVLFILAIANKVETDKELPNNEIIGISLSEAF